MENLKIRLDNDEQIEEIDNIAGQVGLNIIGIEIEKKPDVLKWVFLSKNKTHNGKPSKEITLPELRDMVVLKRNDVNDATHEDKDDPEFKYRLIDNHWYVITDGNPVWRKDSIDLNEAPLFIKPIEKTMKEYLVPQNAGGFMYKKAYESKSIPDSWIAIPEGAECLTKCKDHNGDEWLLFWKGDYKFCVGHDKEWFYFESGVSEYLNDWSGLAKVIWQSEQDEPFLTPECTLNDQYAEIEQVRPQQPEALPFIDDNPQSLNDQYAEIEEVRQAIKVKSGGDSDHMADAMSYGLMGAGAASGGVDATLAERQTQYGCYEDVAQVTQQILSALRIGNYDKLPAPMKESLHMIASKMARIVNGDPEHLDNWHDIGGYAKLIEKLIEGN